MTRRFLDQVGKKIIQEDCTDDSVLVWQVKNIDGINRAFVVESNPGKKFLLGRGIYGTEKFQLIEWIAWKMMYYTWPIIENYLPEVKQDNIEKAPATQF